MITIRVPDGREEKITETSPKEIIPYGSLFTSPLVRQPYAALLYYRDRIIPVHGPLPRVFDPSMDMMDRPWILVFADHARVVIGLPEFDSATQGARKSA